MSLSGKKIAILAEELYEEMELWGPYFRLLEEGAAVILVGTGAKTYAGKHGYPVSVQRSIDEIKADDVDGVLVPGGFAPDKLRRYQAVLDLVRGCDQQGKLVASICHGPWVLCSAKMLRGRRATSVPAIRDDVENAGAIWLEDRVVVDGNLITSQHVNDVPAFNRAIVQWFAER